MKRLLKTLGILVLILILFRGIVFRCFICYQEVGSRSEMPITETALISEINERAPKDSIGIDEIIFLSNTFTIELLEFSGSARSNNPDDLFINSQANCIGYSAMFHAIASYLIRSYGMEDKIASSHKIGKLYFLGKEVHQWFDNPFFKDHDYNEVRELHSERVMYIDPSLSDYSGINRICVCTN